MKHTLKQSLARLGIAIGLITLSPAAEAADHQLSEWKIGETLFGEKITDQDMKGKVVVIEHWGVKCGPCIAMLPDLVKLDKRYRDDGLLLIGAESQNHNKEQIAPLVKKHRMEYTITSGASGPINFAGIPHAFVFDVEGKLVFQGNPHDAEFERSIKSALKAVEEVQDEPEPQTAVVGNLFETRAWTNAEGTEIKAAVKTATEKEVTFVMAGGKLVKYPMEKLSAESRKLITEAMASKMDE